MPNLFSGVIPGAKNIYRTAAQLNRDQLGRAATQLGMPGTTGMRMLSTMQKGNAIGAVAGGYMGGRKSQRDGKGFARGIFTGGVLGGMTGSALAGAGSLYKPAMSKYIGDSKAFFGNAMRNRAARR
jgi:hypothetical protein